MPLNTAIRRRKFVFDPKDDDRTIAIEVEDLGWGISEEDLKPVEQPYIKPLQKK